MKYLKTYKQINEGLRDKMVGVSDEEIEKIIKRKSPDELVSLGIKNKMDDVIKKGLDLGGRPEENEKISHLIGWGHLDIVNRLIEYEEVDLVDALEITVQKGHLDLLKKLFEKIYERPHKYKKRGHPLQFGRELRVNLVKDDLIATAAFYGQLDVIKYLLEDKDVDPGAIENKALVWAMDGKNYDVVKYLLKDERVISKLDQLHPDRIERLKRKNLI